MSEAEGVQFGQALARLDERERIIIRRRFLDEATQSEVAAQLGISQMHVSRIIRRSLSRLRTVADAA